MRRCLLALVALLLSVLPALAAEYKGQVKSVDASKGTITVTIDDKDKTFNVANDVKVMAGKKELKKKLQAKPFDKTPKVTLVTDGEGDKEVVKEIRLEEKKKKTDQ